MGQISGDISIIFDWYLESCGEKRDAKPILNLLNQEIKTIKKKERKELLKNWSNLHKAHESKDYKTAFNELEQFLKI